MKITIPKLSLRVLIGPSGCGKSSFARAQFKATEGQELNQARLGRNPASRTPRLRENQRIPDRSPGTTAEMNSVPQVSNISHQLAKRQRPDHEAANRFRIKARQEMASQ